MSTGSGGPFAALRDPRRAGTLDEVAEALRLWKVWAGDHSYDPSKDRTDAAGTQPPLRTRETPR